MKHLPLLAVCLCLLASCTPRHYKQLYNGRVRHQRHQ